MWCQRVDAVRSQNDFLRQGERKSELRFREAGARTRKQQTDQLRGTASLNFVFSQERAKDAMRKENWQEAQAENFS